MRVHELIEILKKMQPNAEIIVGSHTLKHNNSNQNRKCQEPIGVWPADGVEIGEFVEGGPLYDQNHWVKITASSIWGQTFCESQSIKRFKPVAAVATGRGVPADPDIDDKWYTRHLETCGTTFRGCDPECPKHLAELYFGAEEPVEENQP